MSPKKVSEWTDHLGESFLPEDAFTFTTGNNYGMDGFESDVPANSGLDSARLPETRGLSDLPDGLVTTASTALSAQSVTDNDEGILFAEDISGEGTTTLVDLSWLDPTQAPDPRLPDAPASFDSVSQLEDAWSLGRRTDGINLVPNMDLEGARYQMSLEGPHSGLPGKSAGELKDVILSAVRRLHFGSTPEQIAGELVTSLGSDAPRAKAAFLRLSQDFGLAGHVFIRASAFPGLRNGQWVKEIKRGCKTARYVITEDEAVATKLGMVRVSEVPWREALSHYRPMFQAAGYKVASGHPREVLRKAFLRGATKESIPEMYKPTHREDLRQTVGSSTVDVAPSGAVRAQEAAKRKAMVTLARWVKAGHMTKQEALRLVDSGVRPEMLREAAQKIAQAQTASNSAYQGAGDRALQPRLSVPSDREQVRVVAALEKKANDLLKSAVKSRHLTPEQAVKIKRRGKTASETIALVNAALEYKLRGVVGDTDNTYQPADFNLQSDGFVAFNGEKTSSDLIDLSFDDGPEL